jgi:Pyridoxal-dependent decarboxylase conserved domain
MKRLWQEKRKAAGKSIHEPGPNIVMGANAQVALEKFARYFEVETRLVPISVESKYRLDPKKAMEYVDENTIGVYVILGSMNVPCSEFTPSLTFLHTGTYTGHYEPVKEVADLLDEYEKKTGHSVPIHGNGVVTRVIDPFSYYVIFSGWRVRGLCRSVCHTQARMGLQDSACCLHQYIRTQIRPCIRRGGVDHLALSGISSKRSHF